MSFNTNFGISDFETYDIPSGETYQIRSGEITFTSGIDMTPPPPFSNEQQKIIDELTNRVEKLEKLLTESLEREKKTYEEAKEEREKHNAIEDLEL